MIHYSYSIDSENENIQHTKEDDYEETLSQYIKTLTTTNYLLRKTTTELAITVKPSSIVEQKLI